MTTLDFIVNKYHLDLTERSPISIPNMGRDNLAELFAELGFQLGAEIGSERGRYAEVLCKANPQGKLFCIDPWSTYLDYRKYVSAKKIAEYYEEAKTRLSQYNCTLIQAFSMDAVREFENDSLDFVYIDGNHEYSFVTNDILEWTKKVKIGGIISGHDYIKSNQANTQCHVVKAVNDYTTGANIKPWFIVGTKASVLGEIRDKSRSWFWVKE